MFSACCWCIMFCMRSLMMSENICMLYPPERYPRATEANRLQLSLSYMTAALGNSWKYE